MSFMGLHTLEHTTPRDDSLTHQVRLQMMSQRIVVSCNCRLNADTFDPIGPVTTLDEARELYDNPTSHRKPFTDADKARW